jgi:hypothetical protein
MRDIFESHGRTQVIFASYCGMRVISKDFGGIPDVCRLIKHDGKLSEIKNITSLKYAQSVVHVDSWISQALWQFYLPSPPCCLRGYRHFGASNLLHNNLTGAQASQDITANLQNDNLRWFGLSCNLFAYAATCRAAQLFRTSCARLSFFA